ncbi:MAG TPA: AtpZ/AtpI family protein [Candidatus Acidoferrum sp.]|jgi:ATP synthase protein I|nr:AtpZ/AtpI family protein [Candidatus Acidoferrum sp.]
MPLGNKRTDDSPDSSSGPGKASSFSNQFAMAMELPFVLVGAVLLGGVLGYFLDRWLNTKPWLMLVFGGLGFFGGVRDIIRRMPGSRR